MKAACLNAVPHLTEQYWYRCGWRGEVTSLQDQCPRCSNKGRLASVVEIPKVGEE